MWIAPLAPLLLLVGGVAIGLNRAAEVLLVLLLLVVAGIATITATFPSVLVRDVRLSVTGREDRHRAPGGQVDLTRLVRAASVSYQGGRVSGRGLSMFRSYIWLKDSTGGQAMLPAWGWSPKAAFRLLLRDAVINANARTDSMTSHRIGLAAQQRA